MSNDSDDRRSPLSGPRPSRSHAASSRAQLERILAMTPRERMALALALGRRNAELQKRRATSDAERS